MTYFVQWEGWVLEIYFLQENFGLLDYITLDGFL